MTLQNPPRTTLTISNQPHAMLPFLLLIVWIALTLYIFYRYSQWRKRRVAANRPVSKVTSTNDDSTASADSCHSSSGLCCGLHAICEKGLPKSTEDLYFDDEELDRFQGKKPADYTNDEIEEFRDVMMSVPADELGLWARCIGMRHLMLPEAVRDELLLRMREHDTDTPISKAQQ